MSTAELLAKSESLIRNYRQPPLVMVRGAGRRIFDAEGKSYLDFAGGIAVLSVGHAHPKLAKRIAEQAATLMHASNLFYSDVALQYAERLTRICGFDRVYFCNSGTEANEAMFKLGRRYFYEKGEKNRTQVISTINGFHGRTLGALALTGQPKYHAGFAPMIPGVSHVEYGNIAAIVNATTADTAAIILEPIQAEGGIIVAPEGYLQAVREHCDKTGVLLLLDEVQTGFGRTGRFLGAEWSGVKADAISLAKGIGGGFPLGAMLIREKVAAALPTGSHGSTFGGNPLACAAGLAVLDILEEEDLIANTVKVGAWLKEALQSVAHDHADCVAEVRGQGLLLGLRMQPGFDAVAAVAALRGEGLLASVAGGDVVRLAPALNVTVAECEEAISLLRKVLPTLKFASA